MTWLTPGRWLAFLCLLAVLLSGWVAILKAQEVQDDSPMALVAVPAFQGQLPDGTPVLGIIVVPAENVLNRNTAWQEFSQQWPTQYRFKQDEAGAVSVALPEGE